MNESYNTIIWSNIFFPKEVGSPNAFQRIHTADWVERRIAFILVPYTGAACRHVSSLFSPANWSRRQPRWSSPIALSFTPASTNHGTHWTVTTHPVILIERVLVVSFWSIQKQCNANSFQRILVRVVSLLKDNFEHERNLSAIPLSRARGIGTTY